MIDLDVEPFPKEEAQAYVYTSCIITTHHYAMGFRDPNLERESWDKELLKQLRLA